MSEPIMLLAVARGDRAVASPLFGAVQLTAEFVRRLGLLSEQCRVLGLETLTFLNADPPAYWSIAPGDELAGSVEEFSRWCVHGEQHRVELWGRRALADGSHSELELLGVTPFVSLEEILELQSNGLAFDLWELEDTERVLGTPFLLAVHERMAALKPWPEAERPP